MLLSLLPLDHTSGNNSLLSFFFSIFFSLFTSLQFSLPSLSLSLFLLTVLWILRISPPPLTLSFSQEEQFAKKVPPGKGKGVQKTTSSQLRSSPNPTQPNPTPLSLLPLSPFLGRWRVERGGRLVQFLCACLSVWVKLEGEVGGPHMARFLFMLFMFMLLKLRSGLIRDSAYT